MAFEELSNEELRMRVTDQLMKSMIKKLKLPDFKLTVSRSETRFVGKLLFSNFMGNRSLVHKVPTPIVGQLEVTKGTERIYLPQFSREQLLRLKIDPAKYQIAWDYAKEHVDECAKEERGQKSRGSMYQWRDEFLVLFLAAKDSMKGVYSKDYPGGKLGLLRIKSSTFERRYKEFVRELLRKPDGGDYLVCNAGTTTKTISITCSMPKYYEFQFSTCDEMPIKIAGFEDQLNLEEVMNIPTNASLDTIIDLYSSDEIVPEEFKDEDEDDEDSEKGEEE